jgi:hypothetical protein
LISPNYLGLLAGFSCISAKSTRHKHCSFVFDVIILFVFVHEPLNIVTECLGIFAVEPQRSLVSISGLDDHLHWRYAVKKKHKT